MIRAAALRLAVALPLSALGLGALALSAHAQETRQLGAHVHGLADLAVAADADGGVVAELISPAYNLFGFERAPRNEAESDLIREARAALETGAAPAFTAAAGCAVVDVDIEGGPQADARSDDHDGHHDHDHAHDHNHDHSHDAGHDHSDHGHGHADMVVVWTYACDNAGAIRDVDAAPLFAAFARLERVNAQFFDGARSAAAELTDARPALRVQ